MTEQTVNRRTSVYTIRTLDVTRVARSLRAAQVPIIDQGEESVSFRAPGDAEAQEVTHGIAVRDTAEAWELTTGLGVHRRTVCSQTAGYPR